MGKNLPAGRGVFRTILSVLLTIVFAVVITIAAVVAILQLPGLSENLRGVLIGVVSATIGTLAGTAIQIWNARQTELAQIRLAEHSYQLALRSAALDKRLEAHQHAYSLWRQLMGSLFNGEVNAVASECHKWWSTNCLYLDADARKAFFDAFSRAPRHSVLANHKDEQTIEANFEIIERAGNIIAAGVGLPPIQETTIQSPNNANS